MEMNKAFKYILVLIAFLSFSLPEIMAQNHPVENPTKTEKELYDLFRVPRRIHWMKHFKGTVDGINEVSAILAYDGRDCKGYITFLRSRQKFKLVGELKGDDLNLRETDEEESVTGHVEGIIHFEDLIIKAKWFNREKTRAADLVLEIVNKEVEFPGYCGENKWIRRYAGEILGEPIDFVIQQDGLETIEGVGTFGDTKSTIVVQGEMTNDKRFDMRFYDENNNLLANMDSEFGLKDRITGYYSPEGENKEGRRFGISKREELTVGCVEYQDYMTTYDVTFPKTRSKGFNNQIAYVVDNWKKSCKIYVDSMRVDTPFPGPDDRAKSGAAGWHRMEFMSDTILSGFMTFNKSWETGYEDHAINYDVLNDQVLHWDDIFKSGSGYKEFLREKVMARIEWMPVNGDAGFKEWIQNTEFDRFTIRENGIYVCTPFNPIYGRVGTTVSYDDLQEYLKRSNPVMHFYTRYSYKKSKRK